ncbi:uncharacterized protein LOC106460044 [Limulus polyphemus]|uniref:Uncharacterized protein LOC106460044 n=1 Tax=Limulus polyphemus TaxID=6850 RepID=A0ABM1B5F0_LIMPO|nr:uncharacterized protein LOC106460044 [Limulus polyphemus]
MKILYTLGLLLVVATYEVYTLECHMRELDICAASLLLFNQDDDVAQSEDELDIQCSYIREAQQCLQNYTNHCMTPIQRELMDFTSEGSQNLLKDYCTVGSEIRNNYLKNSNCLNEANKEARSCLTDLQAALDAIGNAEFNSRVTTACCGYQRYMECVRETINRKCGADLVNFTQELLRMAVSRLPDIVCSGYEPDSSVCKDALPPPGTPPIGSNSNSPLSRLFSAYFPE